MALLRSVYSSARPCQSINALSRRSPFTIFTNMSNESLQISPVIKGYLLSRGYTENFTVSPIAGAGSGRQYFRISEGGKSCVLQVCAEVNEDFRHFVDFSKTFRSYGLPVPQVFAVDETACQVLQREFFIRRSSTRLSSGRTQASRFSVRIQNSGFVVLILLPSSGRRITLRKIT